MSAIEPEPVVRWRTSRLSLLAGLAFTFCCFVVSGISYSYARDFSADHHTADAVVIESHLPARGTGQTVQVRYVAVDGKTSFGKAENLTRRYRVGEHLTIEYSVGADVVSKPGARNAFANSALRWGLAGGVGLALSAASVAFPANLRRLDRRDAAQAADSDVGGR